MVFKICEGIFCSSFYVKELDVVHKKIFSYSILAILYPTSLASLVVAVGTWQSHQILLMDINASIIEILKLEWNSIKEYRVLNKSVFGLHVQIRIVCVRNCDYILIP